MRPYWMNPPMSRKISEPTYPGHTAKHTTTPLCCWSAPTNAAGVLSPTSIQVGFEHGFGSLEAQPSPELESNMDLGSGGQRPRSLFL